MKKQTILIVDDMSENVDILVDLLHMYDLVTALDAKSALEVLEEEVDTVDLILLDIMMPDMDGFELCEILKNKEKIAKIPIIFLSAKDTSVDIQHGFELGGVDYITKPFNPNELLARVATHLKLRAYDKALEAQVAQEIKKNKLQEQIIYQSSKQAALGELLMHIAHQWKQPLSALSSIQVLHRIKLENNQTVSSEEQLSFLTKEDDLVIFMAATIDTFSDFYKPTFEVEDFLLTNAIAKVLNISKATLDYNHISVSLSSTEEKLTHASENEVNQVVLSVLNNAQNIFKLRKRADRKLNIFVSDGKIIIEDNAGGIDESLMDKIFLANEGNSNSSGIGLYIAKEIMEKNAGIISAQNTDEGARFTIEFLTWEN